MPLLSGWNHTSIMFMIYVGGDLSLILISFQLRNMFMCGGQAPIELEWVGLEVIFDLLPTELEPILMWV